MRALLVHNPRAGTKGHDKGSIIDALQLVDIKVDYVSTKDNVKHALKHPYDVVVAAGGDGTIGYVFTHLADRSIPIGILPLGSANNVARSASPGRRLNWRSSGAPGTCVPFIWLKSLMAKTGRSCAWKDLASVLWRP